MVAFSGLILIVFGVLPVMGRIVACACLPPCWAVPVWCCSVPWLPAASVPWPGGINNNMNLIVVATSVSAGLLPVVAPQVL